MIKLVGFNGPEAYSVIYWVLNGQEYSKTICYASEEESVALERFYTEDDFYSRYEKAIVAYPNGRSLEYKRIQEMKGA
jgi:hypothetical protein